MGKLFFLTMLAGTSVASVMRPWIGVVAAYLIAILTPQAVWYWNFQGLRPAMWVLLPTLAGFFIALARGQIEVRAIANRRNLFLFGLLLFFNLSYYFGPFTQAGGIYRYTDPAWALETLNKIFIVYFLGVLCIDSERKLKSLVGVFIISAAYLTYWANERYLSGQVMGRLMGPVDETGVSVYADENNFSMLFVVALPFLWYVGFAFRSRLVRWGMWLLIPFGWHAIFLTASRGGLVGVAISTLLITWRSRNRALGLLLIPALAGAYFWQAGDLMRERAGTISDTSETSSASRLDAWRTATRMIADNPVVGVGLASFPPAFPSYSPTKPREAHNTFFQIAAESGLIAGLLYLLVVFSCIGGLWRNGKALRKMQIEGSPTTLYLINEATLVAFCGLFVCSMFLSLQIFEIFWCLCLMTNAVLYLKWKAEREDGSGSVEAGQRGSPGPRPITYGLPRKANEKAGGQNA